MSFGPYLYRGTTAGWPGNPVLREEKITCTSTDPLVATLFAIECRNHGRAIIAVGRQDKFAGLVAPTNHFSIVESAVNLYIPPLQFVEKAEITLEVDRALTILNEIGFADLPIRMDKETRRQALLYTYGAGQRLNEEQLSWFNSRILGDR